MKSFVLLSLLAHGAILLAWPVAETASSATGTGKPITLSLAPAHTAVEETSTQPAKRPPSRETITPSLQAKETENRPPSPVANTLPRDIAPSVIQDAETVTPLRRSTRQTAPASLASHVASIAPDSPAKPQRDEQSAATAGLHHNPQDALRRAILPHFHYPRLAQRRGWQGVVELGVHINADGRLGRIWIKRSSGHRILDRAAEKSLLKVTTLPDITSSSGEDMELVLPVEFRLVGS